MSALKIFDAYSLRARLFPILFASASLLVALAVLIPWHRLSWTHAVAGIAVPVILFVAADIARRVGKAREPDLYKKWGGIPTTRMLRRRDGTIDTPTKAAYLTFLASKIGAPAPTPQDEASDPTKADAYYGRCAAWLRENTRDTKKFSILFNENITYGYRRNLLALKVFALLADATMFIGAAGAFAYWRPDVESELAFKLFLLMAVAVVHAILMSIAVSEKALKEAAETYARQLLLSCETFMGGPAKPAPKPRKGKSAA
jgi:hypothetical protein